MPRPTTTKELRTFLRMTRWYKLQIYNYRLIMKPLYQLLKETGGTHLCQTPEANNAFVTLKRELMQAPALGIPEVTKPFLLFSHERQGLALGLLAQKLRPCKRPVAYFCKQLDVVSRGQVCLPACSGSCNPEHKRSSQVYARPADDCFCLSNSVSSAHTEGKSLVNPIPLSQIPSCPSKIRGREYSSN